MSFSPIWPLCNVGVYNEGFAVMACENAHWYKQHMTPGIELTT